MSETGIEDILSIYKAYKNAYRIINQETAEEVQVAKLLDYDDFRYTLVTVQRPLRLHYNDVCNLIMRWKADNSITKADKALYDAILDNYDDTEQRNDEEFFSEAERILNRKNLPQSTVNKLRKLAVVDETAPEVYVKPHEPDSGLAPDPALKDTETIPYKRDIDEYFETEVLRFVPDAWLDRSQDKLGVEFPFTRIFYKFKPLRSTEEIMKDILAIDKEADTDVMKLLNEEA
jgi:type I restriction enzyme M protein